MTTVALPGVGVSAYVASELRAAMGRKHMNQTALARALDVSQPWLSRRIGRNADVDLTIDEVFRMAQVLDVNVEDLMVDALRACRDSNPKPSDLSSVPVGVVGRAWGFCRCCPGGVHEVHGVQEAAGWVLAA